MGFCILYWEKFFIIPVCIRTKNPALQDSPPAAGRFSGIFLSDLELFYLGFKPSDFW